MRKLVFLGLILGFVKINAATLNANEALKITVDQFQKASQSYRKDGPQAFINHYSKLKPYDKAYLQKLLGSLPQLPTVTLKEGVVLVENDELKVRVQLINTFDATFIFNDEKLSVLNFRSIQDLQAELDKILNPKLEESARFSIFPRAYAAMSNGAKTAIVIGAVALIAVVASGMFSRSSSAGSVGNTGAGGYHSGYGSPQGSNFEAFEPVATLASSSPDPACEKTDQTEAAQRQALRELFCVQKDAFANLNQGCDAERIVTGANGESVKVRPQFSSVLGSNMVDLYYKVKSKYPSSRLPEVMNKLVCSYYGIYFNMDPNFAQIKSDNFCFSNKFEFRFHSSYVLSCNAKNVADCHGQALTYQGKPLCN
ncbi:MAG: hypothetical protein KA116_01090 [Proteobacteria bacterium]|nr:hypothetical protein [Pseudomonadota bacterium]